MRKMQAHRSWVSCQGHVDSDRIRNNYGFSFNEWGFSGPLLFRNPGPLVTRQSTTISSIDSIDPFSSFKLFTVQPINNQNGIRAMQKGYCKDSLNPVYSRANRIVGFI